MAVLAAGAVSRWRELATDELRERVQQLVAARLDADHSVWKAIRRDPVLTARVRGVLSGMASSINGARDEHMRRVWIAAARQALEDSAPLDAPVRPGPPARSSAAMRTPVRHVSAEVSADVRAEVDEEPQDTEPAAPAESAGSAGESSGPAFTSPPPPVTPQSANPRAPIPPMVFSGP